MISLREKIGDGNFKLYAVNSGEVRFKIILQVNHAQFRKPDLALSLTRNLAPYKDAYRIDIWDTCKFYNDDDLHETVIQSFILPPEILMNNVWEFTLSWYNNTIKLCAGKLPKPVFICCNLNTKDVGYVKFYTPRNVSAPSIEWQFDALPLLPQLTNNKNIEDGELYWDYMENRNLPLDALIGGIEKEPTYIIQTTLHNQTIPGKYVPKMDIGFYTLGSREITTRSFKILCGYNAKWVLVRDAKVPKNAFVAGWREYDNVATRLYVARAFHDNNIILGSVTHDGQCNLPYMSQVINSLDYEVLVVPEIIPE